jgi:hypothetical protein
MRTLAIRAAWAPEFSGRSPQPKTEKQQVTRCDHPEPRIMSHVK